MSKDNSMLNLFRCLFVCFKYKTTKAASYFPRNSHDDEIKEKTISTTTRSIRPTCLAIQQTKQCVQTGILHEKVPKFYSLQVYVTFGEVKATHTHIPPVAFKGDCHPTKFDPCMSMT